MRIAELTAKASIRVRKPPEAVFAAFVDAHAMSQFWFTREDEGLQAGKDSTWAIGAGENAFSFAVRVKELRRPHTIVIEWENGPGYTQVAWSIEAAGDGETILSIEESGFTGSDEAILQRVLDSTGGFNQVIVAAKAYLEYGAALNVVAAHV